MSGYASAAQTSGLVTSITSFVEAQVQLLATTSFQALGAPGSTMSLILGAFLTILIALIGYNLLLGHAPSLRSGVLTIVKIGVVLALATSWPAYQALVYDVAIKAPGETAAEIGRPAAIPGTDGSLTQRLDLVDGALVQLAVLGAGPRPANVRDAAGAYLPPPPFAGFDAFALGTGRIIFLVVAIGSLISVRIVAGLALALGPFFIAFMLFASTRSLFEGWVRVLAAAAASSLALSLVMGLQLMLLEPWVSQALERRVAGEPLPSLPADLVVIVILFGLVTTAALFAMTRLFAAFRLAPVLALMSGRHETRASSSKNMRDISLERERDLRTRSEMLADHLAGQNRRERRLAALPDRTAVLASPTGNNTRSATAVEQLRTVSRLKPSTRHTRHRVAASAERRDKV